MRQHEILKDGKKMRVRVVASTRAGLVGASIQGLFEAAEPKFAASEEKAKTVERPFDIKAEGFNALLVAVLNEALRQAELNGEAYEEVRLSLIIDNQATGEFIGRAVKGYGNPISRVDRLGLEVEKNEQRQWETILVLAN